MHIHVLLIDQIFLISMHLHYDLINDPKDLFLLSKSVSTKPAFYKKKKVFTNESNYFMIISFLEMICKT